MNCSEVSLYGISPLFDQTILVKCHICQIVVKLPQFVDHLTKRHEINNSDQLIPTNSNSLISTSSNSNNNNNNASNNINDNTSSSTSSASTSSSVLSWSLSSSSSSSIKTNQTNNNKSKRKTPANPASRNGAAKRKSSAMAASSSSITSSSDVSQEPTKKTLILDNEKVAAPLPPPSLPTPLPVKQSPKQKNSRIKAVKANGNAASATPDSYSNLNATTTIIQQPVINQETTNFPNSNMTKPTTNHNNSNNNSKNANFNNEDNEAKLKYVVEKIKSKLGKSLNTLNAPPTARQPVLLLTPPPTTTTLPPPPTLLPQASQSSNSVNAASSIKQTPLSSSTTNESKPLTPIKVLVNPNTNVVKKQPKQQHKINDDNFLFESYDLVETSNNINKAPIINEANTTSNIINNSHNGNENKPKRLLSNTRTNSCKSVAKVYDPDKHCGVITEQTDELTGVTTLSERCTRSLTCKKHPINLRRQVPGRSKSFNELFKQYRDEKSSTTPTTSTSTTEILETSNQFTNEIFFDQQSDKFSLERTESTPSASIPQPKKIPLIRSTSTTPNKKETENETTTTTPKIQFLVNDTSNFVDLNFKTSPIVMNQANHHNNKFESDQFSNNNMLKHSSTSTSNDFINVNYESNLNTLPNQSIGGAEVIMPNGDIDYRNINQPSFQFNSNNSSDFNLIPETNIHYQYQSNNQTNSHFSTYETSNNLSDLAYLSSPPSNPNLNNFQNQKQGLLTTPPLPTSSSSSKLPPTTSSPSSLTESYYFDSIISKLNLNNNIVKHHPRPSAVTSFNARLTNNGGGYTLWNRRQDNLRNLLCNAFETATSQYSKNRNFSFNQPPLVNNKININNSNNNNNLNTTWVSPVSSLNSNRTNSSFNEYAPTSSQNNNNNKKNFKNDNISFRSKSANLDGEKNQYSLSSLINKKNSFNISNSNNDLSHLKNRDTHISNFNHQNNYQHNNNNNNHYANSNNSIQNDFLTNAIKKAAVSNSNTNTIVPSSHLQSISSSSFSNSSHSWISCPKSNLTNEFLHDNSNNSKNTNSNVNNNINNGNNQMHIVHSAKKNGILNKNGYSHKLQS